MEELGCPGGVKTSKGTKNEFWSHQTPKQYIYCILHAGGVEEELRLRDHSNNTIPGISRNKFSKAFVTNIAYLGCYWKPRMFHNIPPLSEKKSFTARPVFIDSRSRDCYENLKLKSITFRYNVCSKLTCASFILGLRYCSWLACWNLNARLEAEMSTFQNIKISILSVKTFDFNMTMFCKDMLRNCTKGYDLQSPLWQKVSVFVPILL